MLLLLSLRHTIKRFFLKITFLPKTKSINTGIIAMLVIMTTPIFRNIWYIADNFTLTHI